jgi:hypothetical protein
LKTKRISISERFFFNDDKEKYVLRMKLYGSQDELEQIRAAIFNLEQNKTQEKTH